MGLFGATYWPRALASQLINCVAGGKDRRRNFYAVADLVKTYYNVGPINKIVGFESGEYVSQPIIETTEIDEIIIPISWATIHFQLNNPNEHDSFEADEEDYLTAYHAHKTKNFYDSKFFQNAMERDGHRREERFAKRTLDLPGYISARKKRKRAEERRNAWERGSVMLSNFDELYRIMIGARYQELVTTTYSYVICDCGDLPGGFFPIDCDLVYHPELGFLDCDEIVVQSELEYIVWHNKDSDGVVLAESAMDIPQHTWEPQMLEGATHMQVRNSSHTAEMLETVFEGGVGDFFETDVK